MTLTRRAMAATCNVAAFSSAVAGCCHVLAADQSYLAAVSNRDVVELALARSFVWIAVFQGVWAVAVFLDGLHPLWATVGLAGHTLAATALVIAHTTGLPTRPVLAWSTLSWAALTAELACILLAGFAIAHTLVQRRRHRPVYPSEIIPGS